MPKKLQKIYTVGRPFWTLFASWGFTLKVRVRVWWDRDATCFVATSQSLRGLVCEAETREQIEKDVAVAVELLLPLQYTTGFKPPYVIELQFL